ncbi:MAG TPA: SGNH/GDSL hydrolase family protein [Solirubrobacterales bacterium]|nr:SGNH/GDSL hydrolase family protein [Solirubrobacterales bacterium]
MGQGRIRLAALAAAITGIFGIGTSSAAAAPPGLPVQLALGDSWAAGARASDPATTGYVPQLNAALRDGGYGCLPAQSEHAAERCGQLQLVNLAVGGATTPSMIAGQFPAAIELLSERNFDRNPRNDVELITIHIGGNDVTNPILAACLGGFTPTCAQTIQTEFAAYAADLEQALATLRLAAGPETTIVIGTYDNPIPGCQLAAVPGAIQLGALVLEGGGPLSQGLHDIIRATAARHDDLVAESYADLALEDWFGGSDCLHPDDSGYDKVTTAFLEALGAG